MHIAYIMIIIIYVTLLQHNDRIWNQRPLNSTLKDGCVKKVAYLEILRETLINQVFKSLTMASDVYLACLRDESSSDLYKVNLYTTRGTQGHLYATRGCDT